MVLAIKEKKIRRRVTKRKTENSFSFRSEVKGLAIIALALLAFAGIFGFNVGSVGEIVSAIFTYGFGTIGAFIPCAYLLYIGFLYLYDETMVSVTKKGIAVVIFFMFALAMLTLIRVPEGKELVNTNLEPAGGLIGAIIATTLRCTIGGIGAFLVTISGALISFLFISRFSLRQGIHKAKDKAAPVVVAAKDKAEEQIVKAKEQLVEWKEKRQTQSAIYDQEKDPRYPVTLNRAGDMELEQGEEAQTEEAIEALGSAVALPTTMTINEAEAFQDELEETVPQEVEAEVEVPTAFDEAVLDTLEKVEPLEEGQAGSNEILKADDEIAKDNGDIDLEPEEIPTFEGTSSDTAEVSVSLAEDTVKPRRIERPYRYPSLDLLAKGTQREGVGVEVSENARILEETLKSFGVSARIINATQGPAVTRYELEPAAGVKVNKIVNLADDIALKLAAADIRMEAPIPGKAAIGIEVPNKSVSAVHLRDVLECDDFLKAKGGIPVGLGKDIAGKPIITDLAKMPHLLVAGSTGSGKSVCINTLISSILFSRKPEEVKLILIDPKMVELSSYSGVPHLMTPVVTDTKKAASVLRWAVKEMEARYRSFAANNVRDIKRYNELFPDKAMPLVVIIIDELADLMMVSPVDVEDAICRLAQMARAAGLHLVLATQRPSVDVITGTIKANVPSRISFAVSSQIDSRTILDMAGAEKLLGKGDMLFNPIGASKPIRIQGAFISDDEVESLVGFMKSQGEPEFNEMVTAIQEDNGSSEEGDFFEDELLERAIDLVMESKQASVSMLQRRFRIGYTRAARLVDTMEDMKIVGPNMGSKAREILMTSSEVKEKYFNSSAEE